MGRNERKTQSKHIPSPTKKRYQSKSYHGNYLNQRNNLSQWDRSPTDNVAQFEEDEMSVHTASSPKPTPISIEAILKVIQDLTQNRQNKGFHNYPKILKVELLTWEAKMLGHQNFLLEKYYKCQQMLT